MDRPNVAIHVAVYKTSGAKGKEEIKWEETADQITQLVGDEPSIVYCSYAEECHQLATQLCSLGVEAAVYTGQISLKDKLEVYKRVKEKNIQMLIATKAFGVGVDLPGIRHVIHVGLPDNLSLFTQEFGRAGRDGEPAHAHLLVCEYVDMKRLTFWTKKMSDKEKETRMEDFGVIFQFWCQVFSGQCLRQFIRGFFDGDPMDHTPSNSSLPDNCCTGCDVRKQQPLETPVHLRPVARSMLMLSSRGLIKIYEKQLLSWLRGDATTEKSGEWKATHFDQNELDEDDTHGMLQSTTKASAALLIKGALRQMVAKCYVSVSFHTLPNSDIAAKLWSLTDTGRQVAEGTIYTDPLPNPTRVLELLSRFVI